MAQQPPKRDPSASGFDFELVSLEDAHYTLNTLNAHSSVQPGIALDQQYWLKRRRSGLPTDRALAGRTIDWLLQLPDQVRPVGLVEQIPRLANRIAATWQDPVQRLSTLQDLLTDDRPRRQGFSKAVLKEIEALRIHAMAEVTQPRRPKTTG